MYVVWSNDAPPGLHECICMSLVGCRVTPTERARGRAATAPAGRARHMGISLRWHRRARARQPRAPRRTRRPNVRHYTTRSARLVRRQRFLALRREHARPNVRRTTKLFNRRRAN